MPASPTSSDPSTSEIPRTADAWARSFSRVGSPGETAKAIIEASDGTYLVVGDSALFHGTTGFGAATWALQLDALGEIIWQRAFGNLSSLGGVGLTQGVQEVSDGFLIAGASGVIKIDADGNRIWARTYDAVEISSIAAYSDGTFLLAGQSASSTAWAAKLDAGGDLLWSRSYGASQFARVRVTADGGAILLGNLQTDVGNILL